MRWLGLFPGFRNRLRTNEEIGGQIDPEVIQSDPEQSKTDPNLLDAVYDLIKENHAISRAELARRLETSERQVRKAIDELRDKKIRRKGGDSGEWEIIG